MRAHIDTYLVPLTKHLQTEIDTLKPEFIEKIGEKEFKRVDKEVENHLRSYEPNWSLCSLLGKGVFYSKKGTIPRLMHK